MGVRTDSGTYSQYQTPATHCIAKLKPVTESVPKNMSTLGQPIRIKMMHIPEVLPLRYLILQIVTIPKLGKVDANNQMAFTKAIPTVIGIAMDSRLLCRVHRVTSNPTRRLPVRAAPETV